LKRLGIIRTVGSKTRIPQHTEKEWVLSEIDKTVIFIKVKSNESAIIIDGGCNLEKIVCFNYPQIYIFIN